jgi:hypothetical protein
MVVLVKTRCFIAPVLLMAIISCMSFEYCMIQMSRHLKYFVDGNEVLISHPGLRNEQTNNPVHRNDQTNNPVHRNEQTNNTVISHPVRRNEQTKITVISHRVGRIEQTNKTVISWQGVDVMESIIQRYWSGNLFCEINKARMDASDPQHLVTLNITVGCHELYKKSFLGTGNYIELLYGIRMAAHVLGNVDVYLSCSDAAETKNDLILPWLMGWFPPRPPSRPSSIPTQVQKLCDGYGSNQLVYMYQEMQYDLRKMAIGLMGIPRPDHPSARFAEQYLWSNDMSLMEGTTMMNGSLFQLPTPTRNALPPYPASEYELDDAVLHFRCGDLMDCNSSHYGFMKFSGLTRHISPEATSIGILTQPFEISAETQSRRVDSDSHKLDRCRVVVESLVDYIQERHPKARVRIHNGVKETIALTYARMIMANQTIAGISSFSVMPAIATFGTGYIRLPDYPRAPNTWVIHPRIDELTDNVVLFEEPSRIMMDEIKHLWTNHGERGVLEWFWNDTFVYNLSAVS